MLIVLLDEPGLFVFSSPEEATTEIEPIDAESEIRAAFDDAAVPYRVDWLRPNRRTTGLFGLFSSIEPGEYRLVPSGPADRAALIQLLETHAPTTQPREARDRLSELLTALRAG